MQPRSIITPNAVVRIFADAPSALTHIRDHLLTEPESTVWPLVQPRLWELGAWDQSGRCGRPSPARLEVGDEATSILYDLYADAIEEAYHDATRLGWIARDGEVTVAMGTSGLLLVLRRHCICSAFLPGQGDPAATTLARVGRAETKRWIPRKDTMRPGRGERVLHPRERARRRERHEQWNAEQKLFFDVFRIALQFVWTRQLTNRDFRSQTREDYALLKNCLPRRGACNYPVWQAWRARGD